MHVLLVDDDDDLRTTLAEMLEDEGFRVTQAASGPEALKKLDDEQADVIVLDYMMPGMSGADFLAAQRARRDIGGIPVVMITAANDSPALAATQVSLLRKPFGVSALVRRIAEVT